MIALIQRVLSAHVEVAGETIGKIGCGLLVFVAIERNDSESDADKMLERIMSYRVFPDSDDRMNLSVREIGGGLLLISQFTLAADTGKGTRPSFTPAAAPEKGKMLFDYFVEQARRKHHNIQCGQFGADMQVSLINDGPVTFWLQTGSAEKR